MLCIHTYLIDTLSLSSQNNNKALIVKWNVCKIMRVEFQGYRNATLECVRYCTILAVHFNCVVYIRSGIVHRIE